MKHSAVLAALAGPAVASAFTFVRQPRVGAPQSPSALSAAVGVFFGTSTGSTEEAADLIVEAFGDAAAGPFEIDDVSGGVAAEFAKHDALVVGTPTWNTGADTERSGTGWDEVYYGEMQELNIAGKKVAVFGLGDSVSYSENYADATGELHDVFEALGSQMLGYTSTEGYEHDASKAIRGDKFCGLALDAVNQEDLTAGRVNKWVADLIAEGFLEGGAPSAAAAATTAMVEETADVADEIASQIFAPTTELKTTTPENKTAADFVPHLNPRTGVTMWISSDGRSSYFTSGAP